MGPWSSDFDEIIKKQKSGEEQDPLKRYCADGDKWNIDAQTIFPWRTVIWCPKSLDNKAATFGTVNLGDTMPTTLSLVWIHELAHVRTGRTVADTDGQWYDGKC